MFVRNKYHDCPFHGAAMNAHKGAFRVFLEHGLDVNFGDGEFSPLLHRAVWHNSVGVVKVLLEIDVNLDIKEEDGKMALDWNWDEE